KKEQFRPRASLRTDGSASRFRPGAGRGTPLNGSDSWGITPVPLRRGRAPDNAIHPTMTQPDASAPSSADPAEAVARHVPGAGELFLAFAKMAVCGFGGVLAWSRRIIVQERGWLTPEEFNEQLALCQVLPGGNILNFSIMYGSRCAGLPGALA